MLRPIIRAAAAAAVISACAFGAQAAPTGGLAGDLKAKAGENTAVEKAAYRRCWFQYGVRHCRWVGYYDDDYYPYYGYGPDYYGYGPGVGFFFGGGGGHHHGHFHGHHR